MHVRYSLKIHQALQQEICLPTFFMSHLVATLALTISTSKT